MLAVWERKKPSLMFIPVVTSNSWSQTIMGDGGRGEVLPTKGQTSNFSGKYAHSGRPTVGASGNISGRAIYRPREVKFILITSLVILVKKRLDDHF